LRELCSGDRAPYESLKSRSGPEKLKSIASKYCFAVEVNTGAGAWAELEASWESSSAAVPAQGGTYPTKLNHMKGG